MGVQTPLMLDKLEALAARHEELLRGMADPKVLASPDRFQQLAREQASLADTVSTFREFQRVAREAEEAAAMAQGEQDPELREMARAEETRLRAQQRTLEAKLRELLMPKDRLADRNIIMEIRAGAGGDEASLFAGELLRMYSRYAERKGWKVEVLESSPTALRGYKEIIFAIQGKGVYRQLKYESGVHRVQRVPVTESSGRIHTSAATVAVLPEPEDVDVEVADKDLRIDVYRASGAGGQHVNKTESAVRITHLPTGIVVAMQEEKSQHKNKAKAMKILKARIFEAERERQASARAAERKGLVGSGDRSERIRTYNFPQGRVSDHRINLTLYKLDRILSGDDLAEIVDALITEDQASRLAAEETDAS